MNKREALQIAERKKLENDCKDLMREWAIDVKKFTLADYSEQSEGRPAYLRFVNMETSRTIEFNVSTDDDDEIVEWTASID